MRRWLLLVLLGAVCCSASAACSGVDTGSSSTNSSVPTVITVRIDNHPITPATVRFLRRALVRAEQVHATCLVIELDTPGGLLDSTHQIVRDILASRVPVVIYVSPSGARAASAGLFITLSGHVAAMAPGTHIGAAHPVQVGGLPISPAPDDSQASPEREEGTSEDAADRKPMSGMAEKVVNDTEAWARALARLRGHNADWAALAVTESRSITGTEAVEQRVVDFEADSLQDLLQQLDGREIQLADKTIRLETNGAAIETCDMWWGERILGVVANPNVALLLLVFGFYGILFELYSPGWGVIGTLGVLCLILGFFGLSVLPVNYAGLALVLLAIGLFIAEAHVTSFGALTLGGAACLLLGALMLVDSPSGFMRVSLHVALPVAIATSLIALFLVTSVVRAHRQTPRTGSEGLIGEQAIADESFVKGSHAFEGMVMLHGELWRAVSAAPLSAGERATVQGREGLTLRL